MRKNTEPFAGSIGRLMLLTVVEPGTVAQLVPKPAEWLLVCACNRQPVWSAGQERFRFPPLTNTVRFVGAVLTAGTTASVPLAGDHCHFMLEFKAGKLVPVKLPE